MKNIKAMFICLTALAALALSLTVIPTRNAKAANNSTVVVNQQQKKSPPASKVVPVPDDWITMSDKKKGYSFQIPKGTEFMSNKSKGVEVFFGFTPEPSAVGILVMAFKDPKMTKTDLVNFAAGGMQGLEFTEVKISDLVELSADYSLGTFTALNRAGKPVRGKVLVATDVTDNYVMTVGSEETLFKANEKIIDEIWGSFTMQSGGASGKS